MKTILISWIVVVALRGLMKLMADSVTPTERVVTMYTRKPPRRMMIATYLYLVSLPVAVIVTIIGIVMM